MEKETAPQQEYARQMSDRAPMGHEDVLLDVPALHVDYLDLEVTDLRARVSLQAEVLSLLRLNVGIDADLGHAKLDLRGVDAQALLKVRLANVVSILDRVLSTIDANPEIIGPLSRTVEEALRQTGHDAVGVLRQPIQGVGETLLRTGRGVDPTLRPTGREESVPPGVAGAVGEAAQRVRRAVAQATRQSGEETERARKPGPNQPDVEAHAVAAARDNRREEPGEGAGQQSGAAHRYRSLLRRIRRRW